VSPLVLLLLIGAEPTCEETYVDAQRFQRDGKLLEARTALVRCAQRDCPRIAQTDCAQWMAEVEARLPTIVVRALDAEGRDLTDAEVELDAVKIENPARALELDPGVHQLRVDAPGFLPREETITTFEGEKNKRIDIVLAPVALSTPPPPPRSDGLPIWIYVTGGAGLLGMGSFAYFAVTSTQEYENLRSTCAPHCSESQTDPVERKQLVADLSLTAGVVGLASALIGVLIHVFTDYESVEPGTEATKIFSSFL
jgi:hypothetical protein